MAVGLGGAEEHFAKKLANNDKTIRDRAVKRLQAWIASRTSTSTAFGEIELLKIWKGLFYCFWMSDKPLIQEELATNISKLLHSFKNIDSGFNFIVTFFKTFHKEWHGIDRLRLDKFYMLIRFFIKENFEFLSKSNWKSSLCSRLSTIYKEGPLNPTLESAPVGIRLHLCSIFLTELEGLKCKKIPSEAVSILLEPFFILAAQTKSQVVSRALKEGVFEKLAEIESRQGGKQNGNEVNNEDNENEGVNEENSSLEINLQDITERLFSLASKREILGRNRNMLYLYIKKFKKSIPDTTKTPQSTSKKRKIDDLEENEGEVNNKKKKELKRKTDQAEFTHFNGTSEKQCINEENSEEVASKKKRKKKRNAEMVDTENQNGEGNKEEQQLDDSEKNENTMVGSRRGKRKPKIIHNNNDENASGLNHLDEIEQMNRKTKKKCSLDENQNEKDGKKEHKQKKKSQNKIPSQNNSLNESHLTDKQNKLSNQSQVDKQVSKNGVSEDELDKALKEMRQKISEANAASQTPQATKKKKDKNERNMTPQAFATFMKTKTPPAYVRKAVPQTEPKKVRDLQLSTPKSAPHPSRKKVTIELSKNKAQTTLDYVQSLKTSPSVPFDASRSPAFGLLKTDSPQSTPNTKKFTPKKRSKAVDFF